MRKKRLRVFAFWFFVVLAVVLAILAVLLAPRDLPVSEEFKVPATSEASSPATPVESGGGFVCDFSRATVCAPSVGMDAALVVSGDSNGQLNVPRDVKKATLWSGSASASAMAGSGTVVAAGHVNDYFYGWGEFSKTLRLKPYDYIYVKDPVSGDVTRWRVVERFNVRKNMLPADIFSGDSGDRRLVLITCGGRLLTLPNGAHTYEDNVVTVAVPR